MNTPHTEGSAFAVCINNDGYPASLEVGKIYEILVDESADSHGYFRVVDESGEDYAYAKDRFFPLSIPDALERALFRAAARPDRPLPRRRFAGGAATGGRACLDVRAS